MPFGRRNIDQLPSTSPSRQTRSETLLPWAIPGRCRSGVLLAVPQLLLLSRSEISLELLPVLSFSNRRDLFWAALDRVAYPLALSRFIFVFLHKCTLLADPVYAAVFQVP